MRHVIRCVLGWTLLLPVAGVAQPASPVAGSEGRWVVEGAGRQGDARIAPFEGREAVWLRNNTHAILAGTEFTDGTIEFDVAPMDPCDFIGLVFHRQSLAMHENVYLRPRQSGRFMALQYAPRTNGSSTWQLYPEFNRAASWPRNRWTRVRLTIRGSVLQVHAGDSASPVLEVPRLRLGRPGGGVAFWARVNNQAATWAAAIANVRVTPSTPAPLVEGPPPPRGFITTWLVSAPLMTGESADPMTVPMAGDWRRARSEESGTVNVNRLFTTQRGRYRVVAKTTLTSSGDRLVKAGVGYSDEVTVFMNGRPLFAGTTGWESRAPEYAAFVDARFESVWLPLRAGENELTLVVADDQRFGWGFAVVLDDPDLAAGARAMP